MKPSAAVRRPDDAPAIRVAGEALPALGFDRDTIDWGTRLLERCDPHPPFPDCDPVESAADAARLRGVFRYLCELTSRLPADVVEARLTLLLAWAAGGDRDPRVWWDTTNTALRAINLLDGAEYLRRHGYADMLERVLSRGYLRAHGTPLAVGRWVEPKGNHEAITVLGREAVAWLLAPQGSGPSRGSLDEWSHLSRQFLPDGGHVEHCPRYQLQVLSAADTVARAIPVPRPRGSAFPGHDRALSALGDMLFLSVPAPFGDLSRLWSGRDMRSALERVALRVPGSAGSWLPDFGVASRRFETESGRRVELVMDLGPMGSPVNPGHAHDDSLTYCIALDGSPIVIDPATFRYAPDPESVWFKTARAHNVVSHPGDVRSPRGFYRWPSSIVTEKVVPLRMRSRTIVAARVGRRGSGIMAHRRRWDLVREGVRVIDRVRSGRGGGGLSRVNLAPELRAAALPDGSVRLTREGVDLGVIRVHSSHPCAVAIASGRVAPRYGALLPHQAVEWRIEPPAREWRLELTFDFRGS